MNSNINLTHDRPSRFSSDYNRQTTTRFSQMNPKSEVLSVTTPISKFQFAWLVEPDTKFDPMGSGELLASLTQKNHRKLKAN